MSVCGWGWPVQETQFAPGKCRFAPTAQEEGSLHQLNGFSLILSVLNFLPFYFIFFSYKSAHN